jgi:predicted protein tyrosine phosphatase
MHLHEGHLDPQSLSAKIRECKDGVVKNPYQGKDKKVVFVCSMGILRSATGARLYAHKHNTRTAGSYPDALVPLTPMLIAWADELVFVNNDNYKYIVNKYDNDVEIINKSTVLNIPDCYEHMHQELIKAFKEQYEDF